VRKRALWRVLPYLRPHKKKLAFIAGSAVLSVGAQLAVPLIAKAAIDGPIHDGNKRGLVPLLLLAGIILYADDTDRQWLTIAALALFALGLIVFFRMMIRKWTTEIGVTSHRFVKKTGLVSLRTDEIALPNIEGVRVVQGFWGRIWGYGHLRIEGTGVDAVQLPTIADPVGFRRAIETAKGIK